MNYIFYRIVDILLFAGFAFSGLWLIERIAGSKRSRFPAFILVGILSGILVSIMVPLPISIVYIIAFVLLYLTFYCFFHVSGTNNLFGTLAILNSAMCLRGIFASIIALCLNISIYDVFDSVKLTLMTDACADLVCLIIILVVTKKVPREKILLSLKPRAGKTLLMGWMIGSAILLVVNSVIFEFDVDALAFTLLEGNYCVVLLISYYVLLFFTFRFNKEQKTTHSLSSELLAQDNLQSALIQNALFVAKANLTQNLITDGLAVYSETFGKEVKYDDWLEFTKFKVHPEDFPHFISVLNRSNLFDCFERGTEPDPFSYRRLGTDDEYHWVKISIRLYNDTVTGDIHIVGYALDVDNDMRERAELQRRAQTDSLTKLLNRDTIEKAIAQEITKGCGALFLMDIDDFKDVNDCMGHDTGDKVLINAAKRLQEFFGEDNLVGRLGGDEFLAYLKNVNDPKEVHESAEKLLSFLCLPPEAHDEPTITFSLGVAPVCDGSLSFKEVYTQADSALYEKKYNGKHGFIIYSNGK